MSTGPGNIPTRDAPYITPETLERALSPMHVANLLERLHGPWLPESVDRDRKQAAEAIERLQDQVRKLDADAAAERAEKESWKAVAHDHSERLKHALRNLTPTPESPHPVVRAYCACCGGPELHGQTCSAAGAVS